MDLGIKKQRIAEGRALAATGALDEMRSEAEQRPDQPVSMNDILKRAKRRQREAELERRALTAELQATLAEREAALEGEIAAKP